MKMKTTGKLQGIITPILTPLQDDGSLDTRSLEALIERLIAAGIAGVFVLGTTGEGPALSRDLQQQLIQKSVEIISGRCPLLVGISAASLSDSIELGLFAQSAGADAVVAAPPCYIPADEAELEDFYKALVQSLSIPLYLYNMPAMTKITMSPKLIARLSQLPGIVGYKDSAGDMEAFKQVLELIGDRDDFSILMGPDTMMIEAVTLGADGGVNSGSNVLPELFVQAWQAARDRESESQECLRAQIQRLYDIYNLRENFCCGVIAGIKAALNSKGLCGLTMVAPSRPATQQTIDTVTAILDEIEQMKQESLAAE